MLIHLIHTSVVYSWNWSGQQLSEPHWVVFLPLVETVCINMSVQDRSAPNRVRFTPLDTLYLIYSCRLSVQHARNFWKSCCHPLLIFVTIWYTLIPTMIINTQWACINRNIVEIVWWYYWNTAFVMFQQNIVLLLSNV